MSQIDITYIDKDDDDKEKNLGPIPENALVDIMA